jgi:hypothetical protein
MVWANSTSRNCWRRDFDPRQKGGDDIGKTRVGKGMKLEVVLAEQDLPVPALSK